MVWNILTGCINSGESLITRCRRPKWHTPRARLTEGTDVSKFCQQTSCLTAGWKGNHRSEKIKKKQKLRALFLSLGLVSLLQEWNRTNKRDWFVVLRVKWLHRGFFFSPSGPASVSLAFLENKILYHNCWNIKFNLIYVRAAFASKINILHLYILTH